MWFPAFTIDQMVSHRANSVHSVVVSAIPRVIPECQFPLPQNAHLWTNNVAWFWVLPPYSRRLYCFLIEGYIFVILCFKLIKLESTEHWFNIPSFLQFSFYNLYYKYRLILFFSRVHPPSWVLLRPILNSERSL